jgi:CheY-like chemotaxis protein
LLNLRPTAIPNEYRRPAENVGNMTAAELERVIIGALQLAVATAKHTDVPTKADLAETAKAVAATVTGGLRDTKQRVDNSANWRRHILWVDDRPDNNVYERRALEALGITFTLALSTNEALDILGKHRFGAIISDMGRKEGPKEGYVLLDALRARGDRTPFIIYAGSNSPRHKREAEQHGGQGCTSNPQELLQMVTEVLW